MAGDKKWDAAAERDLCVAIIMASHDGRTDYNWPRVHAFLAALGYQFTKDAAAQYFTKVVMKDFRARHGALPLASRPATPVKAEGTPVRRRAPAAAARKAAPSKAVFFDGYDDDDDWGYGLAANKKRKFKQEFAPLPSIKEESETGCDRKETLGPTLHNFKAWLEAAETASEEKRA